MTDYKSRMADRLKESIDNFNNATMPFIDSLDGVLDDMLKKAEDDISDEELNKIKDMVDNPNIKSVLDIINNKFKK